MKPVHVVKEALRDKFVQGAVSIGKVELDLKMDFPSSKAS